VALCSTTQAQGYFTLTNGHFYWFDGAESDSDDGKYLSGYDQANGWAKIYNLGTHAESNTTEITEQGTVYLALDLTDPANPTIKSLSTDDGFDSLCVWYRTGYTGQYYQEWPSTDGNTYRYYLYASHSEGLSIVRVKLGNPVTKSATWYNWDYGAAIEESVWRDGAEKASDFWLIYDTLNDADGTRADGQWRMSTQHCYQRPEEMIYVNYRADGNGGNTWDDMWYYDNVSVGGMQNYPAGNAATFMPVTKTEYAKSIGAISGGGGLTGITLSRTLTDNEFKYGDEALVVSPTMAGTSVTMSVTPAYTKYVEETYRRGINLDYTKRTEETFGKSGVATTRTWYYYEDGGSITRHTVAPSTTDEVVSVQSVVFSLDPRATRYLSLTSNGNNSYTLAFTDRPSTEQTATLTCTVTYTNGTVQQETTTIQITFDNEVTVACSRKAPVVKGSVFGGGRMANVTGNTSVTVHNTDSIYALYGGNDIAGWVQGDDGATIQIGTDQTNEEHPIHIGWVYGGGCGLYTYQGINVAQDDDGNIVDPYVENDLNTSLMYQAYFFNGKVYKWNSLPDDYETKVSQVIENYTDRLNGDNSLSDEEIMAGYYSANWDDDDLVVDQTFSYIPYYYCDESTGQASITGGTSASDVDNTENGEGTVCMSDKSYMGTVPYIKTSHINIGVPEVEGHNGVDNHNAHVHNDNILIDSVFGGAENAFIGVTTETGNYASAITIDINGGTILSVFGGNNYGGSVAEDALVSLNVHCTKMTDDVTLTDNAYYGGYGRDFGIRTLFGGGNMVEGTHSEVKILGGMIDTAFVGGNAASVKNPIGIIDCRRDGTVYDKTGIASGSTGFTSNFIDGHFVYTNPTMSDTANNGADANSDLYVPSQGLYNVRYFFGGNNKAAMDNVSVVELLSGGVGSVYGGGNLGDMNNERILTQASSAFIDLDPLIYLVGKELSSSELITPPTTVGSVVVAPDSSKIIADYIYGGCRTANVKTTSGIYLGGGNVGFAFGGNDVSGDVGSTTDGGTFVVVTSNAVVQKSVYGGSDGYYHCEDAEGHYNDQTLPYTVSNTEIDRDPYNDYTGMLFPTMNHANLFINGGLIKGNAVAGGLMADVGYSNGGARKPIIYYGSTNTADTLGAEALMRGTARIELADSAEVQGNVFGGGANASIYGLSRVYVQDSSTILGSLFAGNDVVGSVESFLPYESTTIDYSDCSTAADSLTAQRNNQAAQVTSNGDPLNTEQDDGSYNPKYSTYVLIEGTPIINSVYGSGNGAWDYDGTRPQFESVFVCDEQQGNRPDQESAYIDIHTSGGFIDTVFGGGAGCSVEGDLVVLLNNTTQNNSEYPDLTDTKFDHFAGGTTRDGMTGKNFVGTIFGGNNFDDMNTVPEIKLLKGNVKNVYGGGNTGNMIGSTTKKDICGNDVSGVSSYVLAESENITITDSLFGGCRMSDIVGTGFVDIRKTTSAGIQYVYGGNDVSGNIGGNTRIDISGGTVNRIWGGSNGRYDYVPIGLDEYNVYHFGEYNAENPEEGLLTTAAQPNVDSTHINLWGGTINASVFAGGSMADSRTTCLIVDDQIDGQNGCPSLASDITITGAIYGGGEGRWDDLNARDYDGNRWGNVNGATNVHLYHAANVTTATAYGGGGGGDVENTYLTTYDTWDSPFIAIFGGCWGSDVKSTAHLTFNGNDLVQSLYGGNDFTGNVYRTEITVNSGIFTNIYGGGNGEYPDSYYTSQHANALLPEFSYQNADANAYSGDKYLTHPNSEFINITFNDGTVTKNIYGGGKLGSTWRYQEDSEGNDLRTTDGHLIPDTSLATADAHTDPLDYSYIITNIHGGEIHNNVFGGAKGNGDAEGNNIESLVYGLKVVNMDNGSIGMSLYGGSESVNDGYASECTGNSTSTTTKRPSSIINITGGTVESNLYGAGYLGTTYGSVYVNVGTDAIDTCIAYRYTYNGTEDSAYAIFKPGEDGSLSPELEKNHIIFNHSIYAGANWGAATGSSDFTQAGYVGGESIITIDGLGYNTGIDETNTLPQMNIKKSLFGSGTSVKGGDVTSDITLRNYGEIDNCHPTKELESVQRADNFLSHRTAVHYLGATDASNAYISEPYSINNIGNMAFRGYNVAEYDAKVDNVGNLYFYEEALLTNGSLELVPKQTLRQYTSADACGNDATICANLEVVDSEVEDKKHTLLILNNGIDFSVRSASGSYGWVYGYGYITTPVGYSSSVTATATAYDDEGTPVSLFTDWGMTWEDGLSGFASPCDTCNKYSSDLGALPVVWNDLTAETQDEAEYPFTNYLGTSNDYREWKIGTGLRLRETTILAHADPTQLEQNVATLIGDKNLALATATLELPATSGGHYYLIDQNEGIQLQGTNSTVNLVDETWYTANTFETLESHAGTDVSSYGQWKTLDLSSGEVMSDADDILSTPNNTFGLLLLPGENFSTTMPSTGQTSPDSILLISGNVHYNASDNYCSPTVTTGDRIIPTMRYLLTYSPEFTSSFVGTVIFTLNEYDASGNLVGPIKVTTYISTILENFRDMKTTVLAMFNNGTKNTFTRKIDLPITLDENRQLYITSVKWVPTDDNGNTEMPSDEDFYLAEEESDITGATPHTVNNLFGMTIVPTDAVTSDLNENLGWSAIHEDSINVFSLVHAGEDPMKYAQLEGGISTPISLINASTAPNGLYVGTLDGRGTASFNINLAFDGSRVYPETPEKGIVGKVEVGMRWVKGENSGDFTTTIYVRTREGGDTIYLATANSVTRGSYIVQPYTMNATYQSYLESDADAAAAMVGKSPNAYVQSFQHALSNKVYQEGDVIAIIDQVEIPEGKNVNIQGSDGLPVQVIRYDGHHHELPDESSVYRGPMIVVDGGEFTARNIDFNGGAGAILKKVDNSGNTITSHSITVGGTTYNFTSDKMPDTNVAFAPIIMVKNSGEAELSNGTIVHHNWNGYMSQTADSMPTDPTMMGAINLTDNGRLILKNNVSILQNLSHTFDGDNEDDDDNNELRPFNGAIYIDGGVLELAESNDSTKIDITDNYLMDPAVHSGEATWWQMKTINGVPSRFAIDTNVVKTWPKANVFLTRTASTVEDDELYDNLTDVIEVSGDLPENSRIGVRKWFPGPDTRDTIRFAINTSSDLNVMSRVISNNNFSSDDGFHVFYNEKVNNKTAYFFRCASFKHQWYAAGTHETVDLPINGLNLASHNVLAIGPRENLCPIGGDSIIYSVQGGFMPYTFTWSDPNKNIELTSYTTPYSNVEVQNDLKNTELSDDERTAKYKESMSNALLLPYDRMAADEDRKWNHLKVTAVDATGECHLQKEVDIRIKMDHSIGDGYDVTYLPAANVGDTATYTGNESPWTTTPTDGWTDTNRSVKAIGSRNFKGVQITPMVWVDRSNGTISASVENNDDYVVYQYEEDGDEHELSDLYFCPGDQIYLYTKPLGSSNRFIMWDFDPYYRQLASYIVPAQDQTVTAYYGPTTYWKDYINSTTQAGAVYDANYTYTTRPEGAGMVTTYNGDVHIYNEDGLAWLISCINGINNTQARTFRFNRVFIHEKSGGYDMKDYLWTPMGTEQHPFMGKLIGVSDGDADTTSGDVTIKNIIVNEPHMNNTGFFGFIDSSRIVQIHLSGALIRGSQYVGTLAAQSKHSRINNSSVADESESNSTSTILSTNYVSGGMIGLSNRDTITNTTVQAKYVGDAVYNGGVVGYGTSSQIVNTFSMNDSRLKGNYTGGAAGYLTGANDPTTSEGLFRRRKSTVIPSKVQNNYCLMVSDGKSEYVGGIIGYAENTIMENNYVYGTLDGGRISAGIGVGLGEGTIVNKNYFAKGTAMDIVGYNNGGQTSDNTDFEGSGNQVKIGHPVYGVDNLTRVLNFWVLNHNSEGGDYLTWRSDLEGVNNGYPTFGEPDMIPVTVDGTYDACDSVRIDGQLFTEDGYITTNIVDSLMLVDSTTNLHIVIHHGARTNLRDSADVNEGYEGYGFVVTPAEANLLRATIQAEGSARLILRDTLQTEYGCDSIVTLMLVFTGSTGIDDVEMQPVDINVYPNPTLGEVTIEALEMSHVELFDTEGRRLQDYLANGDKLQINLNKLSSGMYYLRIHTPKGVTIQKIVKK